MAQTSNAAVGRVDHSALRTNQAFITALTLAGFLLDQVALVAFVALVMVVGTVVPDAGLFKLVYARILRPAGVVRPDVRPDESAPHLFAQGVGATFLVASIVAMTIGLPAIGWVLALIVVVLAGVNLFAGFCAGCFMYYQLARLGVIRRRASGTR